MTPELGTLIAGSSPLWGAILLIILATPARRRIEAHYARREEAKTRRIEA